MRPKSVSIDLKRARKRFDYWRKTRGNGRRIPEKLWSQAAELARENGVNQVCRYLNLDYNRLKRRMVSHKPPAISKSRSSHPVFFEYRMPSMSGLPVECLIEMEKAEGKMRIGVRSQGGIDMEGLGRSFWSGSGCSK